MGAFPHLEALTAEVWSVLDKHGIHPTNSEQSRNTQVGISDQMIKPSDLT